MARKKIDRKDKKCHREFVWLAPNEYDHLRELLGKIETERWIDELNLYIGSRGDKYESHYYTIQVWARKAKTAPHPGPLPMRGEGERAADRVIEALKDPANKTMPAFDPKTTAAIFAVMKKRSTRWRDLRETRHDTTYMEEIHAAVVQAYHAG